MARNRIRNTSLQLNTDDGTGLYSIIRGEQLVDRYTVNWATDISTWEIEVVALSATPTDTTNPQSTLEPTDGASPITLPTTIETGTNRFTLTIPETLGSELATQPSVDEKVYYFFGVKIQDGSDATKTQVWKPFRGVIEVLYTVTSVT